MSDRTVHQLDEKGTVRDWLVTPSWPASIELSEVVSADGSPWGPNGRWVLTNGPDVTPLKMKLYQQNRLPDGPPSAPAEFAEVSYAGNTGTWQRVHTASDGLVDWSEFCFTPQQRIAVAGTVFELDQADWRTLELASTGPTRLFVGGECVLETEDVTYMEPAAHQVRVWLPSGTTEILVCSWQVGFRECRQIIRLRVSGLPVRVVIPSPGATENTQVDQILDAVGTPQWAVTEPEVELCGPEGVTLEVNSHQVTLDGGRAMVRLADSGTTGEGSASMLTTGERILRVSVPGEPQFREFPVVVLPPNRTEPIGEPADWRRELLEHAATGKNGCAAELAAWALDPGHELRPQALEHSLWMVANRADCADFELLGLLHLWHRLPASRELTRDALLGMKYWIDQPGLDAMCYFTENHQLVWHTAELLAGQALPHETFRNSGQTGKQHAEHGRELAEQWLVRKLKGGYSEFDSNAYLAVDVLALTSLVEFAEDNRIVELARNLLDKTLFTLAINSWGGSHACAHGRSYVQTQRSARLEETASIMWLCWGVGALNNATLPATVLATAEDYRLPKPIADAAQQPEEWLARQYYEGEYRLHNDLLSRPYSSDLIVYKTPDVLLSSVQDYRAGLPGLQEYIWGAALGSETQVYVTHAPNDATHSSARPNAWAGNRILPRARQHRNVVLAVYRIPADDPMGFTHAWFPLSTMDEWVSDGPWMAGRLGNGYVALATEGGSRVLTSGPNAYQELRAVGPGTAWVCVVGRRAVDGTFAEFVAGLGQPKFAADGVDYRNLSLHWDHPFTVDGQLVPAPTVQLDNPLCRFEGDRLIIGEHVVNLA